MHRRGRLIMVLVFLLPVFLWAVLMMGLAPSHVGAQTPTVPPTDAPRTEILVFEPYAESGLNQDITVSRTLPALCDQASQLDVNRPDAWACTAAGKVFDPCFANPSGSELACLDLPAVSSSALSATSMMEVVLVNPTAPLDPDKANTLGREATPFLLELVDGQFCVPEPLDVRFASLELYGYCSAGYWFGPGDLSQPLWALPILQGGASPSISRSSKIGVLRLWY